jgi:biopolymer transport protein ExbD
MAFSPGSQDSGGGGILGRRSRFRGGTGTISEINIVPLVDVLMVLLVIFMLTAHVMEFGLEVDVSQIKSTAEILPVITVTRSGDLLLNETRVNINALAADIRKRFPKAGEVYVRADKNVTWSPLAQVISELNSAKLKVKMVTKPVDNARSRK